MYVGMCIPTAQNLASLCTTWKGIQVCIPSSESALARLGTTLQALSFFEEQGMLYIYISLAGIKDDKYTFLQKML